jgi:hypothetical protein
MMLGHAQRIRIVIRKERLQILLYVVPGLDGIERVEHAKRIIPPVSRFCHWQVIDGHTQFTLINVTFTSFKSAFSKSPEHKSLQGKAVYDLLQLGDVDKRTLYKIEIAYLPMQEQTFAAGFDETIYKIDLQPTSMCGVEVSALARRYLL